MTTKDIQNFQSINNKRFIIERSNGTKRIIMANDENVKEKAERFANYENLKVLNISEL